MPSVWPGQALASRASRHERTRVRRDTLQRCGPLLRGRRKGSKKARFLDRMNADGMAKSELNGVCRRQRNWIRRLNFVSPRVLSNSESTMGRGGAITFVSRVDPVTTETKATRKASLAQFKLEGVIGRLQSALCDLNVSECY